jgi:hypothetical protein
VGWCGTTAACVRVTNVLGVQGVSSQVLGGEGLPKTVAAGGVDEIHTVPLHTVCMGTYRPDGLACVCALVPAAAHAHWGRCFCRRPTLRVSRLRVGMNRGEGRFDPSHLDLPPAKCNVARGRRGDVWMRSGVKRVGALRS